MLHDQQGPGESLAIHRSSPGRLLTIVGALWLLLASILLIYLIGYRPQVELSWETATEQNVAGFNLYKSGRPEGDFVLVNAEQFINSRGDPVSGASYSFIDDQVASGETYYYVLEEVELDGNRRQLRDEVFEYSVPEPPWSIAAIAPLSALVGAWMMVRGIKEKRRQ